MLLHSVLDDPRDISSLAHPTEGAFKAGKTGCDSIIPYQERDGSIWFAIEWKGVIIVRVPSPGWTVVYAT